MTSPLLRFLLIYCALGWAASARAADPVIRKSPSPDGRYVLQLNPADPDNARKIKADIVEKATGKSVLDLGDAAHGEEDVTFLVWSADSRWIAYATRANRIGETAVFAWDGTEFATVDVPETLPEPTIKLRKEDEDRADPVSLSTSPRRWRKPGELELESVQVMLVRATGRNYVGTVRFTLAVDAARKATVRNVGKTRTAASPHGVTLTQVPNLVLPCPFDSFADSSRSSFSC